MSSYVTNGSNNNRRWWFTHTHTYGFGDKTGDMRLGTLRWRYNVGQGEDSGRGKI